MSFALQRDSTSCMISSSSFTFSGTTSLTSFLSCLLPIASTALFSVSPYIRNETVCILFLSSITLHSKLFNTASILLAINISHSFNANFEIHDTSQQIASSEIFHQFQISYHYLRQMSLQFVLSMMCLHMF